MPYWNWFCSVCEAEGRTYDETPAPGVTSDFSSKATVSAEVIESRLPVARMHLTKLRVEMRAESQRSGLLAAAATLGPNSESETLPVLYAVKTDEAVPQPAGTVAPSVSTDTFTDGKDALPECARSILTLHSIDADSLLDGTSLLLRVPLDAPAEMCPVAAEAAPAASDESQPSTVHATAPASADDSARQIGARTRKKSRRFLDDEGEHSDATAARPANTPAHDADNEQRLLLPPVPEGYVRFYTDAIRASYLSPFAPPTETSGLSPSREYLGCVGRVADMPSLRSACAHAASETNCSLPAAATIADALHSVPHVSADGNAESCAVCGGGGNIVCCDTCTASYHQECDQELRLFGVPEGDVCCGLCQLRMRVLVELSRCDSLHAALAAMPLEPGSVLSKLEAVSRVAGTRLQRRAMWRILFALVNTADEFGRSIAGPFIYVPCRDVIPELFSAHVDLDDDAETAAMNLSSGGDAAPDRAHAFQNAPFTPDDVYGPAPKRLLCLSSIADRMIARAYEAWEPQSTSRSRAREPTPRAATETGATPTSSQPAKKGKSAGAGRSERVRGADSARSGGASSVPTASSSAASAESDDDLGVHAQPLLVLPPAAPSGDASEQAANAIVSALISPGVLKFIADVVKVFSDAIAFFPDNTYAHACARHGSAVALVAVEAALADACFEVLAATAASSADVEAELHPSLSRALWAQLRPVLCTWQLNGIASFRASAFAGLMTRVKKASILGKLASGVSHAAPPMPGSAIPPQVPTILARHSGQVGATSAAQSPARSREPSPSPSSTPNVHAVMEARAENPPQPVPAVQADGLQSAAPSVKGIDMAHPAAADLAGASELAGQEEGDDAAHPEESAATKATPDLKVENDGGGSGSIQSPSDANGTSKARRPQRATAGQKRERPEDMPSTAAVGVARDGSVLVAVLPSNTRSGRAGATIRVKILYASDGGFTSTAVLPPAFRGVGSAPANAATSAAAASGEPSARVSTGASVQLVVPAALDSSARSPAPRSAVSAPAGPAPSRSEADMDRELSVAPVDMDTLRNHVIANPNEFDWLLAALIRDSCVSLDLARLSAFRITQILRAFVRYDVPALRKQGSEGTAQQIRAPKGATFNTTHETGIESVIDDALLTLLFPGVSTSTLGPNAFPVVGVCVPVTDASGEVRTVPLAPHVAGFAPTSVADLCGSSLRSSSEAVTATLLQRAIAPQESATASQLAPGGAEAGEAGGVAKAAGETSTSADADEHASAAVLAPKKSVPTTAPVPQVSPALPRIVSALIAIATTATRALDRVRTSSTPQVAYAERVGRYVGDPTRCDGCRYGWSHVCTYADVECDVLSDGSIVPPYLREILPPESEQPLHPALAAIIAASEQCREALRAYPSLSAFLPSSFKDIPRITDEIISGLRRLPWSVLRCVVLRCLSAVDHNALLDAVGEAGWRTAAQAGSDADKDARRSTKAELGRIAARVLQLSILPPGVGAEMILHLFGEDAQGAGAGADRNQRAADALLSSVYTDSLATTITLASLATLQGSRLLDSLNKSFFLRPAAPAGCASAPASGSGVTAASGSATAAAVAQKTLVDFILDNMDRPVTPAVVATLHRFGWLDELRVALRRDKPTSAGESTSQVQGTGADAVSAAGTSGAAGRQANVPTAVVAAASSSRASAAQQAADAMLAGITLRRALRLLPGMEDAFFTFLALCRRLPDAWIAGTLPLFELSQARGQSKDVAGAEGVLSQTATRAASLYAALRGWHTAQAEALMIPLVHVSVEASRTACSRLESYQDWCTRRFLLQQHRTAARTRTDPGSADPAPALEAGFRSLEPVPTWGGASLLALETRARYNTQKLMLGRSRIDGTGLFATCDIEMDDVIAEYTGEIIGDAACEERERYYESHGIADYMFRLGPDEIIDATVRGCRARYVNHSCDPNCFAVITLPEEMLAENDAMMEDISDEERLLKQARTREARAQHRSGLRSSGLAEDAVIGDDDAGTPSISGALASTPHLDREALPPHTPPAMVEEDPANTIKPPGAPKQKSEQSGRRVFVYALRRIRCGEELTYDYQFPADERKIPCKCGSAACRGTLNQ